MALLSSIAAVFLAVAGENSLRELVKEVRLPFLLSLITFYVGGATVAAVVARTDYDSEALSSFHIFDESEPFEPMLWLLIARPLIVASLVSAVYVLAGTDWSWIALYSWWMIISVFAGLVLAIVRGAPWRGLLAAAAFVVIFVTSTAATVGPRDDYYDRLDGSYTTEALMHRLQDRVTATVLDAPDVPTEAWNAARRHLAAGPFGRADRTAGTADHVARVGSVDGLRPVAGGAECRVPRSASRPDLGRLPPDRGERGFGVDAVRTRDPLLLYRSRGSKPT